MNDRPVTLEHLKILWYSNVSVACYLWDITLIILSLSQNGKSVTARAEVGRIYLLKIRMPATFYKPFAAGLIRANSGGGLQVGVSNTGLNIVYIAITFLAA